MSAATQPNSPVRGFTLDVPLDASQIEGFEPGRQAKVALQDAQGAVQSHVLKFDNGGKCTARFTFREKPGALSVAVGPPDASDEEIFALQTLRVDIPARQWLEPRLLLPPIVIPPFHWHWWWRWCRQFTVRGQVLCPDGRPVPGARVCAFDVDAWWWWSCRQLVGCATTDASGSFEITFRWCCGWLPWRWWLLRSWYLEHYLVERILPPLQREPHLYPVPMPDPEPDPRLFERLIGGEQYAALNLRRHLAPGPAVVRSLPRATAAAAAGRAARSAQAINPSMLAELREPLLKRLPRIPELEPLQIWPWWPWQPWWDCTPDIVFRVTQNCEVAGTVIYEESYGQAHWNIPTAYTVTLSANDKACCIAENPGDPEGACAVLSSVCDNPISFIGGNLSAPATPAGYLSPGLNSIYGDRPYGGEVLIQGQVGDDVDYYAFQISMDDGATWEDLPDMAVGDIQRRYLIPLSGTSYPVSFLTRIDGRLVFESRLHYEATHDPGTWDNSQFWTAQNYLSLMNWRTATPFLNGSYRLRIKGWRLVDGHLVALQGDDFLPTCSLQTPAELLLRIDNRLVGAASGHPLADPDHPCGPGTVHTCTLEPDTDFLDVCIVRCDANDTPTGDVMHIDACSNQSIGPHDRLRVDFFAHDPEGHLSFYTLQTTYGENPAIQLLSLPGGTLIPLVGAPIAAAAQVGPNYAQALASGAAAPHWHGGAMRLEVPAKLAFPETCCYQLELRAHKRTVVNCDHSLWGQINYSEYSFMIVV